MKRLFLAIVSLAALACAAPTAPKPAPARHDGGQITECRSGYQIATREDGTQECVPL